MRKPLSYAQMRLWLIDQLEPANPMYTISAVFELAGTLRVDAMEAALNEIVRRHEALRTIFLQDQGIPYQVVQAFEAVKLRVVDAETPPRPFDLAKGPLFRVELVRKGEREHLLALQIHHIVSDAWSFKLFTQELAVLYADFVRGAPASLPPLPLQFSDYAVWERHRLRLEPQLAYWKSHLAGPLPVIQLPADRVRQPKQTHRGALHRFYLPKTLMDAVKAFSQAASVTPFMTLLAAFQTLIYRYTGQEDVLVGSAFAGRGKREVHGLIGFFVNTLPLRVHLGGEPSFAELLKRVREMALGAYANQDVPFIKLVQELQPDRDTSYAPLVQIMFVLRQKAPVPVYPLPELTMSRPKEVDSGVAKFELSWSMEEEEENFLALIEYNADLFDRGRIERLAEHFIILLRAAIEQPDRSIAALPLLTERERRLLETADTPAAPQACFHRIFEARAAEDPDKTAVIFGDAQLTYGELDARANRLARYLRQCGVGRDDLVGIRMDRSLDLVVAILGIFKAGGAYVPIDPTLPEERIAFLLEDARPRRVLTRADVNDANEVAGALDHDEDSRQLAYVIYTSGSTGKPKGVQVEHAGLLNLLQAQIETFGVTKRSRVLQFASMSFDASIFEIVMALGTGATLVVAEHLTVGARLLELLERQAITHATLPPSILAHVPDAELPALEAIITAGEACPQGLVDRWAGAHRFFNAYGPTEATVWSTVARCHPGERVTIGRAIAHTQIRILDSRLQPAPVGVPGEMYIGGIGLARGYLGRPDLTKQRFIDSPWGRLYRTGDLGRYLDDGNIDFLGRTDDQVKLRGFRIELEEVESALLQHPGVREAVVLVKDDALAAFYVGSASAMEVRAFVKEKLPSYMVPAVCVAMGALPLTTNNKVDKAALARVDVGQREIDGHDAPTTVAEEVVAGIWGDVLKIDRVGVREDFFGLGGHSLQAVQVVSRLGEAFGRSVPLSVIFERPTVTELAAWLEQAERSPSPALPLWEREPLQLSFAQQRLWFLHALNPGRAEYNIPAVIELRGALDVERLRAGLGQLVARHEALRTQVVDADGVPQAVLATQRLECAVLEDDVQAAALREAQRPFDLANELPIRATLLRVDERHHVLLLTIHHIAADDRSLRILLEDLHALYAGRQLPTLPVQYKDFAAWQRQWLTGDVLTQQLGYWRKQLAHAPPPLHLPAVGPRPTKRTGVGNSASRVLPTALVEGLQRIGRRENATLFMTLLAAFNALLHRYTGETDLLVGTPVANRGLRDVENVVGYFGNTLVLRTDASGEPTFRALVARVRRMALEAYEHADIPFEHVVDELGLARDRGQAPLVQIMFALQDTAPMPSRIGDLEAAISETDNKTAKFDLVLLLRLQEDGLSVRVQYSTDVFDAGTIERMLAHYHELVAGIVQNPDQPIHALPLLTDEERSQRRAWNATQSDYPQNACVHELFEAQVQRTPDSRAVVWHEEHRTYRQLNEEANRLAHHLRRCGVGQETSVALYMDRSLDMIVGLIAILKAGGIHVPLDPGYPQERIALMLSDARVGVLLTHGRLASTLPAHTATVVNLDANRGALLTESAENPCHIGQVDGLAYAIYTSGSTGRPKGVAIPHRAINRLVFGTNYIEIRPEDRIAQASNASFDAAIFEIWGALLHGACLVGIDKGVAISPQDFTEQIRRDGISVLFLTTALFHLIAQTAPSGLRSVRDVLIGGDALDGGCVKAVLEHGPPGRLLNVYGPTESTTFATYHHVRQPPREATIVPIGTPLSNTEIHVLDAHLQPVPVGVPGEIYIGGAGLARGYLHRPELTAERFVSLAGIRLYKTGDRARYLPDGTLEFLERLDHQVKLRGYRIELGEIEATLRAHPSVSDAAVLVREDTPGQKQLIAYVGRAAHHETKAADLRQHVREQLPSFMVPARFVVLDALPLSPNGKVDRKHLAQIGNPSSGISGRESDYVAPRSELEKKISAVWEDVLHRKDVGIHDNFFDLGGSSLLMPRTLSKLNGVLDKKLALITLFQYPSISSLATFLTRETSLRQDAAPTFVQTKEMADTMRASRSRQAQRRRKIAP